MSKEIKPKTKKCKRKKKFMITYVSIQLGTSIISAFSLVVIALAIMKSNKTSTIINDCIQEQQEIIDQSISNSLSYCYRGKLN